MFSRRFGPRLLQRRPLLQIPLRNQHNFIKEGSKSKTRLRPGTPEHTLIPHLFLYSFNEDNVGYVLREPESNSLIAVDVGDTEQSGKVIRGLEKELGAELRYILTTHKHWDHT